MPNLRVIIERMNEAVRLAGRENVLGYPPSQPVFRLTTEQRRYLDGFSVGALVFSYFYFKSVGDKSLMWWSVGAAIIPFLLPFFIVAPFLARRRAWHSGNWTSFEQYQATQQKWDHYGWYGLAVFVLLIGLIAWLTYSTIMQLLQILNQNNPGLDSTDTINLLKQSEVNLGDLLGN